MKWMSEFLVEESTKREPLVNDRQKMVIVFKAVQSYFVFTCGFNRKRKQANSIIT